MEATPLGNTVGTEGVTALKAHIVGDFSLVILADISEVGQRGHGARLWGKLGQPKKYRVYL